MPHFTLQIQAGGPILTAYVGVSAARVQALKTAGQAVPGPVQIRALVDTGASCTCVDPSVLTQLGLTPTGSVSVNTPTTGQTPQSADQYDVGLAIPAGSGNVPLFLHTIPVVASELLVAQGFHSLLGRDILRRCILNYNGDVGFFTIAF